MLQLLVPRLCVFRRHPFRTQLRLNKCQARDLKDLTMLSCSGARLASNFQDNPRSRSDAAPSRQDCFGHGGNRSINVLQLQMLVQHIDCPGSDSNSWSEHSWNEKGNRAHSDGRHPNPSESTSYARPCHVAHALIPNSKRRLAGKS